METGIERLGDFLNIVWLMEAGVELGIFFLTLYYILFVFLFLKIFFHHIAKVAF